MLDAGNRALGRGIVEFTRAYMELVEGVFDWEWLDRAIEILSGKGYTSSCALPLLHLQLGCLILTPTRCQ